MDTLEDEIRAIIHAKAGDQPKAEVVATLQRLASEIEQIEDDDTFEDDEEGAAG